MTKTKISEALPSIKLSPDERLALLDEDVEAVTSLELMRKLHADVVELRGTKGNINRELERIAAKLTKKMFDASKRS